MICKHLARRIVPPILLQLLAGDRTATLEETQTGHIWDGVYRQYKDVPAQGLGLDSVEWIDPSLQYTSNAMSAALSNATIPKQVSGDNMLLPMLASLVCRDRQGVKILDFGGGMGITCIHARCSLARCPAIEYHIVELARVCDAGSRLFAGDTNVHFHSSLPDLSDIDIIYMNSILQYIEDYTSLLKSLCHYQARYFLFARLAAGDIPTYASAQKNLPPSVIPYWFINVREILEIMSEGGYSLIFKGASERSYDQQNFPEEYRLGHTCNLLFVRKDP